MIISSTWTKRKLSWAAEVRSLLGLVLAVLGIDTLVAKPFYIPSESMMPGLLVGDRLIVSKFPYGWSYASAAFHLLPFIPGRLFGRLPERGDVVILIPPDADRHGEDLIKRVGRLPGDTVQMVGGRLWLNGKPVSTRDMGYRLMPIDGNFHWDPNDPEPDRAFPGYVAARIVGTDGKAYCRLHVFRETLPSGRSYDTLDFGAGPEDHTALYIVPANHVFVLGDDRDNSADSRVPNQYKGLGGAVPIENIGGRAEFVTFSLSGNATWDPATWPFAVRGGRWGISLHAAKID